MDLIIKNTQERLLTLNTLPYVDEDWGQLDYYAPNFPVQFPCALIDVSNANYSNIGIDKTAMPINRQNAIASMTITFANLKLTNTSGRSPLNQKNNAFNINVLIEDAHKLIQGFKPAPNAGALIRTGRQRVKRDDGVQEYNVTYSFKLDNV
jgi:hypothetical protein